MITLPRELHMWLQSLNLTYKVTNPKRDLSNGWLYAEILSRYYPSEIEMYQFDNGFKLDKKTNNWEHLEKFFKKKQMPIQFADFDPVIHHANDAAYKLLKKFYTILTTREIDDALQPIQQQHIQDSEEPFYAKPTIAKKLKDHEIERIADKVTQTKQAKTVITTHNEKLRTERLTQPDRFKKTLGGFASVKNVQMASAKVLSQSRKALKPANASQMRTTDANTYEQPPIGDVKQVNVKTANKSIRVMRAEKQRSPGAMNDEDSDELILDSLLIDIVGQVLANKMGKTDPETKNFKESYDKVIPYFTERLKFIPDEVVLDVFQEMNDRQSEFVNVLSRNMLDLCDLIRFFAKCFKKVSPVATVTPGSVSTQEGDKNNAGRNTFQLMVETLSQIGNKLLNSDPLQTEIFFLEYGADELLDIMSENQFKRNEMTVLLYCFIQNTTNSHLRMLQKIKEKIAISKRDAYYQILSRLLLYEGEEDPAPEIFCFYLDEASQGIHSLSPVTRTKCLSILSYFTRIDVEPILPLIPTLQKMCLASDYWELKGQILILCSNALLYFNTVAASQRLDSANKGDEEVKHEDAGSQDASAKKTESMGSPKRKSTSQQWQQISQDVIDQYTRIMFDIIYQVLTPNSPKATIKIGLIYLAKILNFYPEYTSTYLSILLSAPDNIRSAILEVEPLPGTEEEVYVSGANTEKYRTFGAPHEWNSLYIAQALEKHVISNNLENLEWAHIEIFDACLKQDFKEDELGQWLKIFSSLKNYFFISLCYRDFSLTSIDILKKFFCHPAMQQTVIKECLDIFIKTLQLLYQPDCDNDCKLNVKEFLEFLHDFEGSDEASTANLREFVYNAIKNFAEQNQKAYQSSNLIELMNHVVEERRGEIFDETASMSSNLSHREDSKAGRPSNQTQQSSSKFMRKGK